jgi:hypothetical protein
VRTECLADALEDPLTQGVWAGTSVNGRAAMRKAAEEHPQVVKPHKRRLAG